MIHFTKDPDEDITNAAQYYHNFAGAAVQIRSYWTTPIWTNPALLAHSLRLIQTADEILGKYTLKLDPLPWGHSPALRAAIRKAVNKKHPARLTLRPFVACRFPSLVIPTLPHWADDQEFDNLAELPADGSHSTNLFGLRTRESSGWRIFTRCAN
jgi:hypothetical protein